MLCAGADYNPTVLYARQRVRSGKVERHDPAFGRSGMFLPGIYRLLLVDEGSCRIEGAQGEAVIREGEVALLQPGRHHDISMARDSRALLVGFTAIAVPGMRRTGRRILMPPDEDHRQPSPRAIWGCDLPERLPQELLHQVIDDIHHIAAIWWHDDWHHFLANNLLAQILLRLARGRRAEDTRPEPPSSGSDWVRRVQQLIDERLPLLRTTSDLADTVDRNPQAMARVFKAQIGVSPAVYLRRRRLERTIDLVRTTRLSIREIADLVGYRNVGALDHAWRRRFASPPSEWRQQQANQG